jgi:hypothetical protein
LAINSGLSCYWQVEADPINREEVRKTADIAAVRNQL